MARVALVAVTPTTITSNGTNVTDQSGTTMGTGSGNGLEVDPKQGDVLFLKEVTAGAAVVTLVSPAVSGLQTLGAVITDATINLAASKQHVIAIPSALIQADGKLYIDCDVAIEVIQLRMSAQL